MIVRPAVEADHEAIMALQESNPELMVLNPYERQNGPVWVAEHDGKIVGVAIARQTVEAFMHLAPSLSNFQKAKATKLLAEIGSKTMAAAGLLEYHVFTFNEGFAKLCEGLPGAHKDMRRHLWVNLAEEHNG